MLHHPTSRKQEQWEGWCKKNCGNQFHTIPPSDLLQNKAQFYSIGYIGMLC